MRGLVLACALTALAGTAACKGDVVSGLDEAQSQEALAALSRAGVAATREGEDEDKGRRYRIIVPASEVGRAAEVLHAEGLPRPAPRGFAETYAAASMIPSATEEHARFLKALAGEITGQLERFDGVAAASVIVTAPVQDPLAPADAAKGKPSASVLLKLRAGAAPPPEEDVKRLVAASVEGLVPEGVAVVTETMRQSPESRTAFTTLAGIHVARGSKPALLGLLAGALALILAMGVWMLLSARRRAA